MTDPSKARVFVQWKGTNVCCDFWCPCGARLHHDGEFAYHLVCPHCGRAWTMPHDFELEPCTEDHVQPDTGYDVGTTKPPHAFLDDGSRLALADEDEPMEPKP